MTAGEAPTAEAFETLVERILEQGAELSALSAALLAARHLGIAADSRGFANRLGLEHAIVLRELAALDGDGDLVRVTGRDPRTLRTSFDLGGRGRRLLVALPPG